MKIDLIAEKIKKYMQMNLFYFLRGKTLDSFFSCFFFCEFFFPLPTGKGIPPIPPIPLSHYKQFTLSLSLSLSLSLFHFYSLSSLLSLFLLQPPPPSFIFILFEVFHPPLSRQSILLASCVAKVLALTSLHLDLLKSP